MLRPFDSSLAPDLARCYNETISTVPDTVPRPEAYFADPVAQPSLHYSLGEQELVVAEESGQIVGFVHVAVAPPSKEDWHPQGEPAAIRCLLYQPGYRTAGAALLEWAEQWAWAHGKQEIIAWHSLYGYPYQSPWTYLSERLGHVRSLLGMAGYTAMDILIYLSWHDFTLLQLPRSELEFEVHMSQTDGVLSPRLNIEARGPQDHYGACGMERGHASPRSDANDWCYCAGLFINEKVQGRRLGLYLLALGLQEMRRQGCRHSCISVNRNNYRAELLYTNVGYRHRDLSTAWRKELKVE